MEPGMMPEDLNLRGVKEAMGGPVEPIGGRPRDLIPDEAGWRRDQMLLEPEMMEQSYLRNAEAGRQQDFSDVLPPTAEGPDYSLNNIGGVRNLLGILEEARKRGDTTLDFDELMMLLAELDRGRPSSVF